MKSKISAVIAFNRREAIRLKTLQIMLGILMIAFVVEEFKTILDPNVVIIEVAMAQDVSPVVSEDISKALAEVGEVKVASSVPDIVRQVAEEKGFKNVDGLLNLAHCESRFNPTAFNPTNKSNDRGIYQISKRWHPEVSDDVAYDPQKATEWTMERIKAGYGYEWMCWHSFEDSNNKYE